MFLKYCLLYIGYNVCKTDLYHVCACPCFSCLFTSSYSIEIQFSDYGFYILNLSI